VSDIVERLRKVAASYDEVGWHPVVLEAADEIERLRAEIKRLQAMVRMAAEESEILRNRNFAEQAEIERLQAVLEEYACPGLKDCSQPKLDDGSCLAEATGGMCGDAAYRALGETE
jgi:hypothetical protein